MGNWKYSQSAIIKNILHAFYKEHFYKEHQVDIGKKLSKG